MSEPTDDLITDTLWLLGKLDNTGGHTADYWGNFAHKSSPSRSDGMLFERRAA